MLAGRPAVAGRAGRAAEGHREVGHLASADAPGVGAAPAVARRGGRPDRAARDPRRVVSRLAARGVGWHDVRRRGYARERRWPSRGPPRVAAPARIRRCASCRWWRAARTCCSARRSGRIGRGRRRSPTAWCRPCGAEMLCLADRQFFGGALWAAARATGAALLWRLKRNARLPCEGRLPDGSYLSTAYPSERDRRRQTNGTRVRVIDYRLAGVQDAEPLYRLVTTLLDPAAAPAEELAALYHERWEIETALDELKTHLRGAQVVLAEQDAGSGAPGVLRPLAGPLRPPGPHARSRPEGGRRSGPVVVSACGARGASETAPGRRYSPLGRDRRFMTPSWPNSPRTASSPVAGDGRPAASNAR